MMRGHLHSDASAAQSTRHHKLKPSKLENPPIKAAVYVWMFKENLTYRAIQARLLEQFGLKVGQTILCDFYQRNSKTQNEATNVTTIRVELVIRSDRPVAVAVEGKTAGGGK